MWFDSQPSLVVAYLDKMLHGDYLCLVESGKRQMKEVKSKIQTENLERWANTKRVKTLPYIPTAVGLCYVPVFSRQRYNATKIIM